MTLLEAAKHALEALDDRSSLMKWQAAREALDEAIAEAEKQEPVAWMQVSTGVIRREEMKNEALRLALEYGSFPQGSGIIHAIKQALEQPEQKDEKGRPMTYWGGLKQPEPEPVKVMGFDCVCGRRLMVESSNGVVASPPKREWVGLTDEQWEAIKIEHYARTQDLKEAIEAQLKENNT